MTHDSTNKLKVFSEGTGLGIVVSLTCLLVACALILSVIVFVLQATTPFPIADAWYYISNLIQPWQEGRLTVADFFVMRGASDHMQPLYRLILLIQTVWFHMDFTVEALIGVVFAIACVYLWYRLSRNELARPPGSTITASLIGLGLVAVIFSLNARGVYDWSLVALAFMGIFAVSVLLAATPSLVERRNWILLGFLVLLVFIVDNTYGILVILCAGALLTLMLARDQLQPRSWLRACGVLVGVGVAYLAVCHALFPYRGAANPDQGFGPLMTLLKAHWRESFKLIAVPAGTTLAMPERIEQTLHIAAWQAELVVTLLAIPICAAHVWFWINYLRGKPNTLVFLAAGLMLFFYLSLAAILLSRLPAFGFDYLYEPRYMQVYELQLVAFLMMSARVLSEQPTARLFRGALTVAVLAFTALTFWYAILASREVPYIQAFHVKIATQMEQLAIDPANPPKDCLAAYITPCSYTIASERTKMFQTLERGPYNVFSPTFRRWHRHQVPKVWAAHEPAR